MLKTITHRKKIEQAQRSFERILVRNTEGVRCIVGHRGESFEQEVYWSSRHDIWTFSGKLENRFWNAFGIGKPLEDKSNSIVCEINFHRSGINRYVSGLLFSDNRGTIYVGHRGSIRGGRPGIGKTLFVANYYEDPVLIEDGDQRNSIYLVGRLGDPRLPALVADFVKEVDRIKNLSLDDDGRRAIEREPRIFVPEFAGRTQYEIRKFVDSVRYHGIVVNQLKEQLRERGYDARRDQYRDLYILGGRGRPSIHFEVKTNDSTGSIYSAIGQLLFHSPRRGKTVRLVAVLPSEVSAETVSKLKQIGITTLKYYWRSDQKVVFRGLDKIL